MKTGIFNVFKRLFKLHAACLLSHEFKKELSPPIDLINSDYTSTIFEIYIVGQHSFSAQNFSQTNHISSLPKPFYEGVEKSSHYTLEEYFEHSGKLKTLNARDKREMIINT